MLALDVLVLQSLDLAKHWMLAINVLVLDKANLLNSSLTLITLKVLLIIVKKSGILNKRMQKKCEKSKGPDCLSKTLPVIDEVEEILTF